MDVRLGAETEDQTFAAIYMIGLMISAVDFTYEYSPGISLHPPFLGSL